MGRMRVAFGSVANYWRRQFRPDRGDSRFNRGRSRSGLYQIDRREGRQTPFLFTSGYAGRGEDPLDPALPFLPKPWTSADLLMRVRHVLDGAKQRTN